MDSQYPALQLGPLSGVTNAVIDRTNPSIEEYITPVLGTLMVHGITKTENNSYLHLSDVPSSTDCSSGIQKATTELSVTSEPITPNTNVLATNTDIPTSDEAHGVTDGALSSDNNIVHATILSMETSENAELNGVTNNTKVPISDIETYDSVKINGVTINSDVQTNETNGAELNGVTNNSDIQTDHTKTNESNIKGVTGDGTQATIVIEL